MKYRKDYQKIKNNYIYLNQIERLILWSRFKITPIDSLLDFVPSRGRLLDLGCGFGSFAYFFAFLYPQLEITAIDPAEDRISLAKKVYFHPSNLSFASKDIKEITQNYFDAITIIDVIYLIPPENQFELFKHCFISLKKGGSLIIKSMNKERFFRFFLITSTNKVLTWIFGVVRILFFFSPKARSFLNRIAGTRHGVYNFCSPYQTKKQLEENGFKVEIYDATIFNSVYPSIIYMCIK